MLLARGFLQLRGEAGRECNLRRTEGEVGGGAGGIKPGRLPARPRNILPSLPLARSPSRPPAKPLLPAPPASRPWACSRDSAARHWGPPGLGGGVPRLGSGED